jgi:hypothetical protein
MPKKKNKKDKKDAAASDPVEAIRAAVERTFHATSEGAAGTQKRSRQLVDEVTHAAARIRATIEELRVLDEVKGLRDDIEALGRRIAALESRESTAKPAASTPASRARTTRTASSRSKSTGTTRAKSTGTTRAKSSATTRAKPAAARKPATARKPRATRSSTGTRTRSPRSSGSSS